MRVAELYANNGHWRWLVDLCQNNNVPDALRNYAYEKLPEVMEKKGLDQKHHWDFVNLSTDSSINHRIRVSAGLKIVELYKQNDMWQPLVHMAANSEIPDSVQTVSYEALPDIMGRIEVPTKLHSFFLQLSGYPRLNYRSRLSTGLKVVGIYEQQMQSLYLIQMSIDKDLPDKVQKAAKDAIRSLSRKSTIDPESRHKKMARDMANGMGKGKPKAKKKI
jgi:hypothetical protein